MTGYFVLNLPGPRLADLRQLSSRRIRRSGYPLDEGCGPDMPVSPSAPNEAAGADLQARAPDVTPVTRKVEGQHAD